MEGGWCELLGAFTSFKLVFRLVNVRPDKSAATQPPLWSVWWTGFKRNSPHSEATFRPATWWYLTQSENPLHSTPSPTLWTHHIQVMLRASPNRTHSLSPNRHLCVSVCLRPIRSMCQYKQKLCHHFNSMSILDRPNPISPFCFKHISHKRWAAVDQDDINNGCCLHSNSNTGK